MFDCAYVSNCTTDEEEKQDTNLKKLQNLHLLKETDTGYKLLCEVGSLQKNLRQFAVVYLQTPQGELYPQERVQMSGLKNRKGTLDFILDLPDGFSCLEGEELEQIRERIIEILQSAKEPPVCMGEDEPPQGVYEAVVRAIWECREDVGNNPKAPVFIRDGVGYVRTTCFDEFSKRLQTGYGRKEILGLLKLSGKMITDKDRAYDKRLHFGQVNGKYYAVRLPQNAGKETKETIKLPPLDKKTQDMLQTGDGREDKKITLFGYYGGKNRISDRLNIIMPKSKIFAEPFVGSGTVLLNRERSGTEIVNDFDPAIANLYKVMADKETGRKLLEKLFMLPYDEGLFREAVECQKTNFKGLDDIDKALMTFVLVSQSYNNTRKQFSRGDYDTVSYQKKIRSNLPKVYERLQGV